MPKGKPRIGSGPVRPPWPALGRPRGPWQQRAAAAANEQQGHLSTGVAGREDVLWRKGRAAGPFSRSARVGYVGNSRIIRDPRLAVSHAIRQALRPGDPFRAASPIVVLDAEGQQIATVDPVTRERRPV